MVGTVVQLLSFAVFICTFVDCFVIPRNQHSYVDNRRNVQRLLSSLKDDTKEDGTDISTSNSENELRQKLKESITTVVASASSIPPSSEDNVIKTESYMEDGILAALKQKRSYISILAERAMQTIDDYQLSSSVKSSYQYTTRDIRGSMNIDAFSDVKKEKIVVLGSGWGAHSFLKTVDSTKYDVQIISPRNYFTFTPMLAASAVGTVEFRSICEPIRNVNPLAEYLEAAATSINFENKTVSCTSVQCAGTACNIVDFEVDYDYLLVGVGATVNTFGVKGVREHCQFLKQVEDAAALRKAIGSCFERANIPGLTEQEVRDTLSFVIVGAGPTGVEFTSELRDWVEYEGRKYYGRLLRYVKITLVEAGDAVLAVFDQALQLEALKLLTERQTGLLKDGFIGKEVTQVLLKSGVKEVGASEIEFTNGDKLPYGFCVWAAGNGPIPLVAESLEKIEYQKNAQKVAKGRLVVDRWLRLVGAVSLAEHHAFQ
jgi:NADH dehydrogenase FAD-containing subunit